MIMNQCEEVFSERINTPFHHDGPFAEERARYLAHLLERGWVPATVIGKAYKLAAFAAGVDITSEDGVNPAQIEAAADDWIKQRGHYFRQPTALHRSRKRFVNVATDWLRF